MREPESIADGQRVSVVTPTRGRPEEVLDLLGTLSRQTRLPFEVILVDGAPQSARATEALAAATAPTLPFPLVYVRREGGTAPQRNAGIDLARGDFVAFVDDDVRPTPDFFAAILDAFERSADPRLGAITGYRVNLHPEVAASARWRWYRRLGLLTTFEPGRYDFATGYPVNANLQPPFTGLRRVDFATTACTVWRREVFDSGLRFDPYFAGYGVLEDAHLSLTAGLEWRLAQCGDARCLELHSPRARARRRLLGYKCVVNYYYVFSDVVRPLPRRAKVRFWTFQAFELGRVAAAGLRRLSPAHFAELAGRLQGIAAVATGRAFPRRAGEPR